MKIFLLMSFVVFSHLAKLSSNDPTEEVFTNIYDQAIWGYNENGIGFSGGGSTVQAVAVYMKFLQNFIKKYHIETIVDVGCGDWTFSKYIDWNGAHYIGVDIVKPVIERNQKEFSSPNVTFFHANATNTDLPSADLLICKEVLQHLSNKDVSQLLKQFPKFKHCLITNDVDRDTNTSNNWNITSGGSRTLDLTAPPFNIKGVKALTYRAYGQKKVVLHIEN